MTSIGSVSESALLGCEGRLLVPCQAKAHGQVTQNAHKSTRQPLCMHVCSRPWTLSLELHILTLSAHACMRSRIALLHLEGIKRREAALREVGEAGLREAALREIGEAGLREVGVAWIARNGRARREKLDCEMDCEKLEPHSI